MGYDEHYISLGRLMATKKADKKLEKIAKESILRERIRKNHPRLGKFLYGTYLN